MPSSSSNNSGSSASDGARDLSAIESEFVRFFVQMANSLSLPRSVGEIFGLLFAADSPVAFDEVVRRLGISKGSVSQGLRMLVEIGAASTVYVPGDRRTFYQAETSMRKLFGGALNRALRPHLEGNRESLASLEKCIEEDARLSEEDLRHYEKRLGSLRVWNQKALQLLPLLETLFSISSPASVFGRFAEAEIEPDNRRLGAPSESS